MSKVVDDFILTEENKPDSTTGHLGRDLEGGGLISIVIVVKEEGIRMTKGRYFAGKLAVDRVAWSP